MRIPVTKRWRFPGAASFTLQPLLPRWLLSFRSLRRSSRFFSRSYIFFFVSIFSSRSSTSSVSNQSFRYVLPFHSIFASSSFTCLFRCSWPASLVTSFLACNNLDYHLQSERPLAATRSHAWPPAASCGHFWPQQIGQRFGSQLGTIAPRTPKKKIRAFCDMTGLIIVFPVLTLYRVWTSRNWRTSFFMPRRFEQISADKGIQFVSVKAYVSDNVNNDFSVHSDSGTLLARHKNGPKPKN